MKITLSSQANDHRSRGTFCYRDAMKFSKVAVCCLILAVAAVGECVEVEPGGEPSSQRVRITTVVNSKATSGVKVDIYRSENPYKHSVVSDRNGVVVIPKLAPGIY